MRLKESAEDSRPGHGEPGYTELTEVLGLKSSSRRRRKQPVAGLQRGCEEIAPRTTDQPCFSTTANPAPCSHGTSRGKHQQQTRPLANWFQKAGYVPASLLRQLQTPLRSFSPVFLSLFLQVMLGDKDLIPPSSVSDATGPALLGMG